MQLEASRLNKKSTFGQVVSVELPNGVTKDKFSPLFTKKCGVWHRSLDEAYAIVGTELEDTIILLTRHDKRLNKALLVQFEGITYDIKNIESDESPNPIKYDLVTIKEVAKNGK